MPGHTHAAVHPAALTVDPFGLSLHRVWEKQVRTGSGVRDRVVRHVESAVAEWAALRLPEIRQRYDVLAPEPSAAAVEPAEVAGMAAAWVSVPGAKPRRTLLYCHGGGYQIGSVRSHLGLTLRLAAAADARVLAFEYRLAPEHRFPCAAADAWTAYRWLLERHGPPDAVAGDSAGAALAIAAAVQARDAGAGLPGCLVLLSPWLDLAMRGESYQAKASLDVFSKPAQLRAMARTYLGRGGDPAAPLASPVEADLAGLPPILLHAGDCDITLDDSPLFAARARAQGCDAELTVFPGMFHHFQMFGELPESAESVAQVGSFVARHAP